MFAFRFCYVYSAAASASAAVFVASLFLPATTMAYLPVAKELKFKLKTADKKIFEKTKDLGLVEMI
ncbi:MAG: hypothetical protein V3T58_02700 [Candidatus Hydrothermarchaeales archaeon]